MESFISVEECMDFVRNYELQTDSQFVVSRSTINFNKSCRYEVKLKERFF